MQPDSDEDHEKELHALRNKILAFPEEDWTRERERVAELQRLIASETRTTPA